MRQVRLDPTLQAGFAGAPADAAMPVPLGSQSVPDARKDARPRRSLVAIALRMVRDAAIAVALLATIPIAVVSLRGPTFVRMGSFSTYVRKAVTRNEAWRPLMLPHDASITPGAAGLAYAALQPVKPATGYVTREPDPSAIKTWRDLGLEPGMFQDATPSTSHVPSAKAILQVASKGLRPSELRFLQQLAMAPAWRDFDIVARAPAVDILGGQFAEPFRHDVFPEFRPTAYGDIREMAYAAVSRAAYHMAIGQRDSAEVILRSIISVGFALVDNGTTAFDEMMGMQLVDVGRVGLRQFYEIQHDPRAAALAAPPPVVGQPNPIRDADAFRTAQMAKVEDAALPRGERFEALGLLAKTSCTNVRDLVAGPRADVVAVLDKARRDLPRYASERALFDALVGNSVRELPKDMRNPFSDVAVSAATVAGVAFHNPRFAQCARILTVW